MTEWGQGLSSRLSLSQKGISLPERGWTAQRALRTPPGRTKRWREPRPGLAALGSSATVPTKEGLLAAGTEERPRQARRPCKPQACGAEARVPPAMQAPGLRGRGSGPAVRAPRGRRWGRAERRDSQGAGAREPRRGSPAGGRRGGGPAAGARRGAAPAACCPGVNGAVGSWAGAWKGRVSSKCISGRRRGGGGLGVGVEFGTCPNPRGKKGVEESPAKPRCLLTPSSPLLLSVVWIFLPFFLGSAFFPTSSYLNEQTHTMKTQWAFWRIFRPTNAVL